MNKVQICEHLVWHQHRDEWTCKPKNVAQSGNWIFHVHPDYPDEADCLPRYRIGKRKWVIHGEMWDGVPTSQSPVGTKDKAKIAATVAKLDVGYRDHLIECKSEEWIHFEKDPKKRYTHQLRAISGDCAAGGLSEKGDILPFTEDNLVLVYDYLLADLNFHRSVAVNGLNSKLPQKANRHFYDCAHEMQRKKIFQHKWHARTSWVIEEFDQWEMLR